MDVLYPRCAGLDLAKDSLMACIRIHGHPVKQECRSFGTTTRELLALAEWLTSYGVTHVAMEATGTYWKGVWHVLEPEFTLLLAHAGHIKGVPGRKSDVNDAMWIATGLISDVLGVTGRSVLRALIAGETDPERLAELARGTLKAKRPALRDALTGCVTAHHQRLLKLHLTLIEQLEAAVADLDRQLGDALAPFHEAVKRLDAIPGINTTVAQAVLGEIGLDMTRFPTHEALVSWACLCRRLDESAGKRRSTRTRKGACWLKTVLVQAAWAAVRTKDSYLRAQFLRLRARRGPKKAIVAVAASMLTGIYYVLRDGVEYRDLGANYFQTLDRSKVTKNLVRRLQNLGYRVELHKAAA